MGKEIIAGFVTLGLGVIAASVAYQVVKPNSQGTKITGDIKNAAVWTVGNLYKG